ncbi:MAG: oligosaccharide flippase family protein [Bacteroidota bacterium]|nr:oligosaccharide flippase family protein [Bacteroidota bacterium]
MNTIKQLAGQTLIYGLGTIAPKVLNFLLLTPFYTYIFGLSEYGIVTELYSYVALLMVVLTFGMETTFFRFASTEKDKEKVYSTGALSLITTSALFLVGVCFFLPEIASTIKYQEHPEYILWLTIILSLDAIVSIPFARLRQENRAMRFSLIKIANISVNIIFNLLFFVYLPHLKDTGSDSALLNFYNEDIGVGYAFIANLIATSFTCLLLIPEILKIKFSFDFVLYGRMISYAYPLVIIGIAGMINEVSDKIMLKFLVSVPEGIADKGDYVQAIIGEYGANTKIAVLMTLFIQMFKFAAEPFFFSQAKEKNANQTYADVMKYFVVFGLLIFLGVMLYLDIFKYFINEKFHGGLFVVPIILAGNLFLGIFYNLSVWYKLKNITKYGAIIALIGASLTILINVIFVPIFGYIASAWGHFACYLSMMVISFYWGRHYLKIDYEIATISKFGLVAVVVFVISLFNTFDALFLRLAINTFLFVIFVGSVYIIDKRKILEIIKK